MDRTPLSLLHRNLPLKCSILRAMKLVGMSIMENHLQVLLYYTKFLCPFGAHIADTMYQDFSPLRGRFVKLPHFSVEAALIFCNHHANRQCTVLTALMRLKEVYIVLMFNIRIGLCADTLTNCLECILVSNSSKFSMINIMGLQATFSRLSTSDNNSVRN